MVEARRDIIQPEMVKSDVWLQTSDGSIEAVEQEVALFCPLIYHEKRLGFGSSKNHPIGLPSRVTAPMLCLILDYCRFHQVPGRSDKERKFFDEKFMRMDTKRLCELVSAADSLQLLPLVDLTSCALARLIEGKTPKEMRDIFNLPDDLTQEEKLEPIKNTIDDPRIRLLNRLYSRKRKELKERDKSKDIGIEEDCVDERSVEDLLSFINGGSKGVKSSKNKKKNRKRKDPQKNTLSNGNNAAGCSSSNVVDLDKQLNGLDSARRDTTVNGHFQPNVGKPLKLLEDSYEPNGVFDYGDLDDDIDPALKEKIDREVEDFARRLNSTWPDQMQQERMRMPMPIKGNGALSRYPTEFVAIWPATKNGFSIAGVQYWHHL